MDPDPGDIDIDLDVVGDPSPPAAGARPRRRTGWVLAGVAALLVGLTGSTGQPLRPVAGERLPVAHVTSGAVREYDVPRLPPGDVSGDSAACWMPRREDKVVVMVPCGTANLR